MPLSETDPHLYLIDASAFFHRAFHAFPALSRPSDNHPCGAILGYCEMLWKLRRAHTPSHLAVVLDGGRDHRIALYPAYKANRGPMDEALSAQFRHIRRVSEAFGFTTIQQRGHEADDVIATLAENVLWQTDHGRVTIVSTDKDLMQLVGERVQLLDMFTPRNIGTAEVIAKFGVHPESLGDLLALMGDVSDNIPGVPGVGPKTAAKLIAECGDIKSIIACMMRTDALARGASIPDGVRRKICANVDALRLSRQLVALKTDLDLDVDLDAMQLNALDADPILALCDEFEFVEFPRRVREALTLT